MTINPDRLTNFGRTRAQLEELALYATIAAGKPAHRMAEILDRMLTQGRVEHSADATPFELVRIWLGNDSLGYVLRKYGVGKYTMIERCWRELTELTPCRPRLGADGKIAHIKQVDLKSVSALEQIHGIGPKSARLVVLHSVKAARCIPVDTHWVKELYERGYPVDPDCSITPKVHAVYEQYALAEVDKSGMTCAVKDLAVWIKWNRLTMGRAA